jgi:hypothetical protein
MKTTTHSVESENNTGYGMGNIRLALERAKKRESERLLSARVVETVSKTVCAWCNPGPSEPGTSHGICSTHAAEFRKGMTYGR